MNEGEEPVVVSITDVLDLHSFQPRDVVAVVEEYLYLARERGFSGVRIVHGRGIGVAREQVRKVLARTPYVVAYRDAPLEAGGWGATVVTFLPDKYAHNPAQGEEACGESTDAKLKLGAAR